MTLPNNKNPQTISKPANKVTFSDKLTKILEITCLKHEDLWSRPLHLDKDLVEEIRDELRIGRVNILRPPLNTHIFC